MRTCKVILSDGRTATIDADDLQLVSTWKWFPKKSKNGVWYAQANLPRGPGKKRGTIFMHRLIMGHPVGKQVDHVNHDGLDNRRANLRVCSHGQNCGNKRVPNKRFKGVLRVGQRWKASIKVNGKTKGLGRFDTEEAAARAYDAAAGRAFGEFAQLNFPGGRPQ